MSILSAVGSVIPTIGPRFLRSMAISTSSVTAISLVEPEMPRKYKALFVAIQTVVGIALGSYGPHCLYIGNLMAINMAVSAHIDRGNPASALTLSFCSGFFVIAEAHHVVQAVAGVIAFFGPDAIKEGFVRAFG